MNTTNTQAPAATEAPSTVTEAVEYAKRTLERIALSIGTSTTAENERSWRSAADMAMRSIEWALARTPAPAVCASPEPSPALKVAIDALEILNRRPRPMCRDCADEDGTCPSSGLPCDMRATIRNAREALAELSKGAK